MLAGPQMLAAVAGRLFGPPPATVVIMFEACARLTAGANIKHAKHIEMIATVLEKRISWPSQRSGKSVTLPDFVFRLDETTIRNAPDWLTVVLDTLRLDSHAVRS